MGRHELGIRIIYITGSPKDRANKGYRIWYKAVAPSGEAVTSPKQLNESFFTKRKKDVVLFKYEDSGKTRTHSRKTIIMFSIYSSMLFSLPIPPL
ncbi:MAG: hypothetical protein LBP19_06355 [Treponema sp.]|nr:hypothetical protein [Treponema sp.]